jgi:aerobic carbon-monoxide dehydrogenase medium subunit
MRLRFARPAVLVDLGTLSSLRYVRDAGEQLAIGALTRHHDLNHDRCCRSTARSSHTPPG